MSENLELLPQLSALYKTIPKANTQAVLSVTTPLQDIVTSVSQDIVTNANVGVSGVIDDILRAIQAKIDDVKSWVTNVYNGVYRWLFDRNTGIVTVLSDKINGVANQVINGVIQTIGTISDAIGDAINALADKIQNFLDTVNNIVNLIPQIINLLIQNVALWLKNAIDTIAATIGNFIGGIVDWVTLQLTNVWNGIKQVILDTYNNIASWFSVVYTSIKETIEGVGRWISDTYNNIKRSIEDIINDIWKWLGEKLNWLGNKASEIIASALKWLNDNVVPLLLQAHEKLDTFVGGIKPILDSILKGDAAGAFSQIDKLFTSIGLPAPVSILENLLYFFAYLAESVRLRFIPAQIAASKYAEINLAMTPLDLSTAHEGVEKGVISEAEFIENARLAGVNSKRAKQYMEAVEPLAPVDVIRVCYLRNIINEGQHDSILRMYGYKDDIIKEIKETYKLIPGITDLVHFADRWAWDDNIAKRFQYDTGFPDIVNDWVQKIGLSSDWFKRYWRSHWQLPGLQDVFEMYHRLRPEKTDKPFTKGDLDAYLLTTPLPPYFHDLIRQITFLPLTRVDIRRMYQAKVLDEEQVYHAYLDLGYNAENASNLRDFTIRYYSPEDATQKDEFYSQARTAYSSAYKHTIISEDEYRTLLKGLNIQSDDVELLISLDNFAISYDNRLFNMKDKRMDMFRLIASAYSNGILDNTETEGLFESVGLTTEEANLELSILDYNYELQDRQTLVDRLHDQFVGYMIDDTELNTILAMFNFSGLEIDKLVASWNIEKGYRTKRPSLSDLRKFLNQGILSLEQFLTELRGIGYAEKYIEMYNQSFIITQGKTNVATT